MFALVSEFDKEASTKLSSLDDAVVSSASRSCGDGAASGCFGSETVLGVCTYVPVVDAEGVLYGVLRDNIKR